MSQKTKSHPSSNKPIALHVLPGQHVGPIPFGLPLFQFVDMFLVKHKQPNYTSIPSSILQERIEKEREQLEKQLESSIENDNTNNNNTTNPSEETRKLLQLLKNNNNPSPLFMDASISHPNFPGEDDIEVELPACGLVLCFDSHSHRFVSAWFTPGYAQSTVEVFVGGMLICKTNSTAELPTLRRIVDVLGPTQPGSFRDNESMYDVVYPGCVITFNIPEQLRDELCGGNNTGNADSSSNTTTNMQTQFLRKQETGFRDGTTPVAQRIVWHSMEPGSQVTRSLRLSSSSSSSSNKKDRSSTASATKQNKISSSPPSTINNNLLTSALLGPNASLAEVAVAGWATSTLQESSSFLAAEVMPGVGVRFHCRPPAVVGSSSNNFNSEGEAIQIFGATSSQLTGAVGDALSSSRAAASAASSSILSGQHQQYFSAFQSNTSISNFLSSSQNKINQQQQQQSYHQQQQQRERQTLRTCEIVVGQSPQDVVSLFGQPQIIWPHISKPENVIGHAVMLVVSKQSSGGGNPSSASTGSGSGESDLQVNQSCGFSFCYPALGFNVIFGGNTHPRVESIVLSNSVPGHEYFLRYARCPFALFGTDNVCLNLLGISTSAGNAITSQQEDSSSSLSSSQIQNQTAQNKNTLVPGLSNTPAISAAASSSTSTSNKNRKSGGSNKNKNNKSGTSPANQDQDSNPSDSSTTPIVPPLEPASTSSSSMQQNQQSGSGNFSSSSTQGSTVRKVFDSYSNWSEIAGHVAGTAREKLRRIPLSSSNEEAEMQIIDRAAKIPPGLSITAAEGPLRVVPLHGLCFTVASSGAIASIQIGRLPRRMAKTTIGRSGNRIRLPVRSDASSATAPTGAEPRVLARDRQQQKNASSSGSNAAAGILVVDDIAAEFDDCKVEGEELLLQEDEEEDEEREQEQKEKEEDDDGFDKIESEDAIGADDSEVKTDNTSTNDKETTSASTTNNNENKTENNNNNDNATTTDQAPLPSSSTKSSTSQIGRQPSTISSDSNNDFNNNNVNTIIVNNDEEETANNTNSPSPNFAPDGNNNNDNSAAMIKSSTVDSNSMLAPPTTDSAAGTAVFDDDDDEDANNNLENTELEINDDAEDDYQQQQQPEEDEEEEQQQQNDDENISPFDDIEEEEPENEQQHQHTDPYENLDDNDGEDTIGEEPFSYSLPALVASSEGNSIDRNNRKTTNDDEADPEEEDEGSEATTNTSVSRGNSPESESSNSPPSNGNNNNNNNKKAGGKKKKKRR